ETDRDVLGAAGLGRRVAHPLPRLRMHRLAGARFEPAALVLDDDEAGEDERVLVEGRGLWRLLPALRARHLRDRDGAVARVHATDVLLDPLRQVAGRLDH